MSKLDFATSHFSGKGTLGVVHKGLLKITKIQG